MSFSARATIVLVDNSPVTLDGDFSPNRLEVQKITIEKLADDFFQNESDSQIGIITMSEPESGIRSSLTSNRKRILSALSFIIRGKEKIDIEKGLKRAVMAIKQVPSLIEKRILLFIASDVSGISSETCLELNNLVDRNNVALDIVTISSDVTNIETLKLLNQSQQKISSFIRVIDCQISLSDYVLASTAGMPYEYINPTQKSSKLDEDVISTLCLSNVKENRKWIALPFRNVMQPLKRPLTRSIQHKYSKNPQKDSSQIQIVKTVKPKKARKRNGKE